MKQIACIQNDEYYISKIADFVKIYTMWSGNRPIDKIKVLEIKNEILRTKKVDGLIYIGSFPGSVSWVCYDGNHRASALVEIYKSGEEEIDVLFVKTRYLFEKELSDRYLSLNKAVSVPEIYKSDNKHKTTIEKVVRYIERKYKEFKSTSNSPKRPNFNRDLLTNYITDHISDTGHTYEKILEDLEYTNQFNKKNVSIYNLTNAMLGKCDTYNCYLFVDRPIRFVSPPSPSLNMFSSKPKPESEPSEIPNLIDI